MCSMKLETLSAYKPERVLPKIELDILLLYQEMDIFLEMVQMDNILF